MFQIITDPFQLADAEAPPVAAERHVDRLLFVSGEGVKELAVAPVPHLHLPINACHELPAVGTECHDIRRPIVYAAENQGR